MTIKKTPYNIRHFLSNIKSKFYSFCMSQKNRPILGLVICVLITILVLSPQLRIPWMLIDDGENIRMGQEISNRFSSGDYSWILSYEKDNGRFRPVYWFWHYLNYRIFGISSFGHHFGHLILYVSIAILIYLITLKISKKYLAGIFSVIFFLFFYPAAENFFRLGTAEPPLLLLYLLIVYCLVCLYFDRFINKISTSFIRNLFFLVIFFGLAYFAKESSPILMVALIPFAVGGILDKKIIEKEKWGLFVIFLFLVNIIIFIINQAVLNHYGISGGYAEAYKLDVGGTVNRYLTYIKIIVKEYSPILIIIISTFIISLFKLVKKMKITFHYFRTLPSTVIWEAIMIAWVFIFLTIQAPWIYVMGRYLPPITVWLSIFAGIECAKTINSRNSFNIDISQKTIYYKFPLTVLLLIFGILFFVTNQGVKIFNMYKSAYIGERYTRNVVRYLAENVPTHGSVYVNFSEGIYEYLYEIPLHFRIFYSRPDIKTDYLYIDRLNIYNKGDFIISFKDQVARYPKEKILELFEKTTIINPSAFGSHWQVVRLDEEKILGK